MYSETAYNCSDGYIVATSGNEKNMVKTERHLGLWAQSASIRDKNNQHSVLLRNIKNSKKGQKRFLLLLYNWHQQLPCNSEESLIGKERKRLYKQR